MASSFLLINTSGDRLLINTSNDRMRIDDGLSVDATGAAVSGHDANVTTDTIFAATSAAVSGHSASFGIPRAFDAVCMALSSGSGYFVGPTRFNAVAIVQSGRDANLAAARDMASTAATLSGFAAFLDVDPAPIDLSLVFAEPVIRPVILVDLELDSGPLHIWTGMTDISIRGITYKALSGFDTGVSVRESIGLDVLSTDFRLSGQQLEFLSIALTENYQGRLCRIYMGALDARGNFIGSELIFTGYLDDMPISLAADRGDLLIKAANVLTRNSRARGLRYTPEDQKQLDSTDTLFDFITTLAGSSIEFGRTETPS